jgi:signal transduction histidine kinase
MEYSIETINLKELLKSIVDEYSSVAKNHNLDLKFICVDEKPILIKADKLKVKQIFSNLVDNGIKYTKEGGVTIKSKIEDDKVITKIIDTGIGISPEKLQQIFGKFIRSEEAIKMDVGGTGLGLYVAKVMTEAMSGNISVKSEGLNMGSTFSVEFPLGK